MKNLGFWTAVTYGEKKTTCSEKLLERVDSLLNFNCLGCKTVKVIRSGQVVLTQNNSSWFSTVLKAALVFTGVIPILLLIAKAILHRTHTFALVDEKQPLSTDQSGAGSVPPSMSSSNSGSDSTVSSQEKDQERKSPPPVQPNPSQLHRELMASNPVTSIPPKQSPSNGERKESTNAITKLKVNVPPRPRQGSSTRLPLVRGRDVDPILCSTGSSRSGLDGARKSRERSNGEEQKSKCAEEVRPVSSPSTNGNSPSTSSTSLWAQGRRKEIQRRGEVRAVSSPSINGNSPSTSSIGLAQNRCSAEKDIQQFYEGKKIFKKPNQGIPSSVKQLLGEDQKKLKKKILSGSSTHESLAQKIIKKINMTLTKIPSIEGSEVRSVQELKKLRTIAFRYDDEEIGRSLPIFNSSEPKEEHPFIIILDKLKDKGFIYSHDRTPDGIIVQA